MLTILFALITSCGTESSEDTQSSFPSNQMPSQNLRTVRFLPQWYHQAQFAGVYMAKAKGIYTKYGINLVLLEGGPQNPAAEALKNNKTDFTTFFLITALIQNKPDEHLVNIAQISQKSSLMLVAKRERGINSIQDLNFRKVGLWRTDFRDLSLIFFKKYNLDVSIVPVDRSINLFLKGPIDAMNVMRYNEYHLIQQAGVDDEELFIMPYSDLGLNILEDGLYCKESYYKQNPELCRDFAEATMEGWLYAVNHPDETLSVVLDLMRRSHIPANRPHQRWMLEQMKENLLAREGVFGTLEEDSFTEAQSLLLEYNLMQNPTDYRRFCPHAQTDK